MEGWIFLKKLLLVSGLALCLVVGGCSNISQSVKNAGIDKIFDEKVEDLTDSVLSAKRVGTIPGRAILDHSPKAWANTPGGEENSQGEGQGTTDGEEDSQGGEEDQGEDSQGEEKESSAPSEENSKEDEYVIDTPEELHPSGVDYEDLTPVENVLVDYQRGGRWVREVLDKDGDRYAHPMVEAKIPDELITQARAYFNYMTEINDYLGDHEAYKGVHTDVTLRYAYKYEGTNNYVFFFREYIPKTLLTTNNEAKVVVGEDGGLVQYLSFGERNKNALTYEPRYDEKEAEKRLWRKFSLNLHYGYADEYQLTDMYLKIPTNGDYRKAPKAFRPQWFGEFRNENNSFMVHIADYY